MARRRNLAVQKWFGQDSTVRAIAALQRKHEALHSPLEGCSFNVRT